MFIKVNKANQIVQYPYTLDMLRQENQNTSLPQSLSNRFLAKYHVFPVIVAAAPEYVEATHYIEQNNTPVYEDNQWVVSWSVLEKSEQQATADTILKSKEIRNQRSVLLAATDWVVIKAIDEGIEVSSEWKDYRKSLRDITSQPGFPWEISWPHLIS